MSARRVISHVDKVHYIKQLVEGLDLQEASQLEDTYIDHDPENDYVSMEQVIYVGDGNSDMSAFQVVEDGAIAINPKDEGEWKNYDKFSRGRLPGGQSTDPIVEIDPGHDDQTDQTAPPKQRQATDALRRPLLH